MNTMKTFSFTIVLILINISAAASNVTISDFVRNEDMSVKAHLNWQDASNECLLRGSRLPTAREFAKEAEKYGGKILKIDDYKADKIPSGFEKTDFYQISSTENNKTDAFYYSYKTYRKPSGDLAYFWTWTSSIPTDKSDKVRFYDGESGSIFSTTKSLHTKESAVRCVLKL